MGKSKLSKCCRYYYDEKDGKTNCQKCNQDCETVWKKKRHVLGQPPKANNPILKIGKIKRLFLSERKGKFPRNNEKVVQQHKSLRKILNFYIKDFGVNEDIQKIGLVVAATIRNIEASLPEYQGRILPDKEIAKNIDEIIEKYK